MVPHSIYSVIGKGCDCSSRMRSLDIKRPSFEGVMPSPCKLNCKGREGYLLQGLGFWGLGLSSFQAQPCMVSNMLRMTSCLEHKFRCPLSDPAVARTKEPPKHGCLGYGWAVAPDPLNPPTQALPKTKTKLKNFYA